MPEFVSDIVLKRDVFSETHKGHFAGQPDEPLIRRIVSAAPWWSRPLAWVLARREIAGLRAVAGIAGTPQLLETDKDGLVRRWSEGTPLHLARPGERDWYLDAARLLREMRRAGVTHNDLAKPQNWLMLPDGSAGVIDFQLSSRHRRRGKWYRLLAYEDLRHLVKIKAAFAPQLLTATEHRILANRSLPSRIWRATGKRIYNFITRGLFDWSDGEGTGDRIANESEAIISTLKKHPAVGEVALAVYPLPRKGTGIYAFAEMAQLLTPGDLEKHQTDHLTGIGADLIQPVKELPRRPTGEVRDDILSLIAMNQMTELDSLVGDDKALAEIAGSIADRRLNTTDRRISQLETR
ncbi:MAG: serine/threonine protein kinase [Rhizobiaceae bacterium]